MKVQHTEINASIREAVEAAAKWYTRLNSGESLEAMSQESLEKEWQNWLTTSTHNRLAWQEIENIQSQFSLVPERIASPVLKQTHISRRELLQRLGMVAALAPLSWFAYQVTPWKDWRTDYHTATGEQRTFTLMDGSSLALNTDSSVDVNFTATQRLIQLHKGEVLISTAKIAGNATEISRPFQVKTPQGIIRALGTRFIVHSQDGQTKVTVLEEAVRIKPELAPDKEIEIRAGQQLSFTKTDTSNVQNSDPSAGSWIDGSLVVVNMPLGELINELSRYRQGILRCENSIKHIKISGAFPLGDTERALQTISHSFPVRQSRITRYWITIVPT
jgi:transmembrane sensor